MRKQTYFAAQLNGNTTSTEVGQAGGKPAGKKGAAGAADAADIAAEGQAEQSSAIDEPAGSNEPETDAERTMRLEEEATARLEAFAAKLPVFGDGRVPSVTVGSCNIVKGRNGYNRRIINLNMRTLRDVENGVVNASFSYPVEAVPADTATGSKGISQDMVNRMAARYGSFERGSRVQVLIERGFVNELEPMALAQQINLNPEAVTATVSSKKESRYYVHEGNIIERVSGEVVGSSDRPDGYEMNVIPRVRPRVVFTAAATTPAAGSAAEVEDNDPF